MLLVKKETSLYSFSILSYAEVEYILSQKDK